MNTQMIDTAGDEPTEAGDELGRDLGPEDVGTMRPEDDEEGKRGDRGFTLVELLVVVVILGILASVVVFSVANISSDAQESACVQELRQLQTAEGVATAVESYAATSPATMEADLVSLGLLNRESAGYDYDAVTGEWNGTGKCAP